MTPDSARAMYRRQLDRNGETITLKLSGVDYSVRARLTGCEPHELGSGVQQYDRTLIVLAADVPVAPKVNDHATLASGKMQNIQAIDDTTRRVAGEIIAYEITTRGP